MSSSDADEAHKSLVKVLELERNALLTGKLEAIDQIKQQKDQLAEYLSSGPTELSIEDLQSLQALSRRNNRLYDAALQGLGSARARVDGWREAQHGLTTYTSERRSVPNQTTAHNHEKRA